MANNTIALPGYTTTRVHQFIELEHAKTLSVKKIILSLVTLLIAFSLDAQILWLSNFDKAKEVANELNKLIVIDFGANWCAPCRNMDQMVWENSEMETIAKNFVALKINVDHDRVTPGLYSVSGIPKVVIATASGFPVWMSVGFSTAEPLLAVLRSIPVDTRELNESSIDFEKNKKDLKTNLKLALALQNTGKGIKNDNLKSKFLERSDYLLVKIKKLSPGTDLSQEVDLYSVLNILYNGKPEKALKKIEKSRLAPVNEKIEDLMHYVLAKCYWETRNQDDFRREKQLIKSRELSALLE